MNKTMMVRSLLAAALAAAAVSARADVFSLGGSNTSLSFVTVGDLGNLADSASHSGIGSSTSPGTGLGAVGYTYQMGKYDVTLAQYTAFLNAVAKTDTYGCYNSNMAGAVGPYPFGISQTGSSGNYSYSVTGANPQAANMPVSDETWGDVARFCNWLQNGQGTAANVGQAYALTETGAYALSGATSNTQLMAVPSPAHSGSGAAQ